MPSPELRLPGRSSDARGAEPPHDSKGSMALGVALGLAVVVGGGLAYRYLAPPDVESNVAAPSASESGRPAAPPRCAVAASAKDFVVGDAQEKKPAPTQATGATVGGDDGTDAKESEDDPLAPFAVQLGRAVATTKGFAVGALQRGEGGAVVSLVTLDASGSGSVVRLMRSRADLDPPVVASAGDALLVAALEPNAGGLGLKVGRVAGDKVEWGAELDHPRSDSLALDLATSGGGAAVVWDDLKDDASRIMLSSFAIEAGSKASAPRVVSPEKTDAESPRLVARKDGFYLLYVARGAELTHADEDYPEEKQKAEAKAKADDKARQKDPNAKKDDEVDESRGERMFASWVEALPLDVSGAPAGGALKLTKETGHITGYDVAPLADGFAMVWRDEDSPSGGAGGVVRIVRVTSAGPSAAQAITDAPSSDPGAASRATAVGIPTILDGWVSVPELSGGALLGRISSEGSPVEAISLEASLGRADPVAARAEQLLVAEPVGRGVRLRVLTCPPATR